MKAEVETVPAAGIDVANAILSHIADDSTGRLKRWFCHPSIASSSNPRFGMAKGEQRGNREAKEI
jgi:hypothetical protein